MATKADCSIYGQRASTLLKGIKCYSSKLAIDLPSSQRDLKHLLPWMQPATYRQPCNFLSRISDLVYRRKLVLKAQLLLHTLVGVVMVEGLTQNQKE